MMFDSKKLIESWKARLSDEVQSLAAKPRLGIITLGKNPVTQSYLKRKIELGSALGCDVRVYVIDEQISTTALRKKISELVHVPANTGIIVQLPLPKRVKTDYIVNAVPAAKDVDMLSSRAIGDYVQGRGKLIPPIVAAVEAILENVAVNPRGKNILVIGAGRLVGKPISLWLLREGFIHTVIGKEVNQLVHYTKHADIIITGTGHPKLITGEMVKEGVIILDAGTAESSGTIVGDVDAESVAKKAQLLTPVPGGIGPLTVLMVFRNLIEIAKQKK